jgi:DNA-binding response OmpR family regulator
MRLLVIDDDAAACATMSRRLKLHGFRVVCANDGIEALHQAAEEPFDLVILSKPVDADELCSRIRAIFRRAARWPRRASESLQVGELRLVFEIRDAYFRGRRLGLTATEYDILERFMHSCGRVVSRDEISLQLYNREMTAFDRVLDTHIARIRKKLGDGRGMIISVRGVGYQLCPPSTLESSEQREDA